MTLRYPWHYPVTAFVQIAFVLAMALFIPDRQIALAQTWNANFDFRATQGFVTDPTGDYAVLGKATLYPTTKNGVTYGWASAYGYQQLTSYNLNAAVDPRLAGANGMVNNVSPAVFEVDLPAPGTYNVSLAIGLSNDFQACNYSPCQVEFRDGSTSLFVLTIPTAISPLGAFVDANGQTWSAAAWPASNTTRQITLAGTHLTVLLGTGGSSSSASYLSFLGLTQQTLSTPNFTASASPTAVSVATGNSGNSTISTTAVGGFNSAISLSASGAPGGVTVSFNPTSISGGAGTSTMTMTVGSSVASGTYPITVTASGGGITPPPTTVNLTVASSAQAWQAGFDFRAAQGFVTDPAGDYAVLGKATLYPTTKNGVTYGWASAYGYQQLTSYNLNAAVDPRLAGANAMVNNVSPAVFEVDLPAPGTYNVSLAIGLSNDFQACNYSPCQIEFRDGSTSLFVLMIQTAISPLGAFLDANGKTWSAAAWPASNTTRQITLAGTRLTVLLGSGGSSSSASYLSFLGLTQQTSSTPSGSRVSVTPSSTALTQGQSQAFTANVQNSTNQSVAWSMSPNVGTISTAGVYTAPATITTAQTVTVTATSVAAPSQSASSIVNLAAAVNVSVTPSSTTLTQGQSQAFTANVQNSTNQSVAWSMSPNVGTISAAGVYTAPATITTAQTVTVIATSVATPSQSANSSINLLPSIPTSPVSATPGATATQYVLSYTAAYSSQCMIEVSTSPTYSPLVHAVDPKLFANANYDGQTNSGSRAFVAGQKWIGQENIAPPSIAVAIGNATRNGTNLVTVNYANQPFVVGDNITITDPGSGAYSLPWARVQVASTNSFSYEVVSKATDSNPQILTITRTNRYSLALQADANYYYRIGGPSNTCGASPATGTFTTMNIPNGNTWAEGPVRDNNGSEVFPTVPESHTATLVDPLTGVLVHRLTLYSDAGWANGWSSSFFRVCNITPSANGFYHCAVGQGGGGSAGMYAIKDTGEVHYMGFPQFRYIDSHGATFTGYLDADSANSSTTNANLWYKLAATNGGYQPNKNVLVSFPFTGNDSVDAAGGSYWGATATALTPDPSNTLDDQMNAFSGSSSILDARKFHGCKVVEVYGDHVQGLCYAFNQGSPTTVWIYQISTNSLAAFGGIYNNPRCRWCGSHGTTVNSSVKWTIFTVDTIQGSQEGEWQVSLVNAIGTTNTSLTVTAPRWQANTTLVNGELNYTGYAITDSNNNLEIAGGCGDYNGSCPGTLGTTGGAQPTWNTAVGGTTTDGTVTWKNYGPTDHPNEPQNIFPRNMYNYGPWSFLTPVAGAYSGGGGPLNGDLFFFRDGTNECIRVITVGSSGQWTMVQRAVQIPGSQYCLATTPQPHAAGARIEALCEAESDLNGHVGFAWDYVDDPHMADTTNTHFVRLNFDIGHGYSREVAPSSWNSGQIWDWHNPWIAADFTGGIPNRAWLLDVPFAGFTTSTAGAAHNDYTNWDFENASFTESAITTNVMFAGGGTNGYGTFTKVAGTNSIYKYAFATPGSASPTSLNHALPWVSLSGPNTIKDISGPGSALTDGSSTPASCVVVVAGECWTGSSPGEAYANLPVVDSGALVNGAYYCNNGGEGGSFEGHDWCMLNQSTNGDAIVQAGLLPANFLGNYPYGGWPEYGSGLSRQLIRNIASGLKTQANQPHVIPDGSGFLFTSCIADPTQIYDVWDLYHGSPGNPQHGGNNTGDHYGCQAYLAMIPPQPPADGIDRTDYENVTVPIGAGSGGATHARVKYGYEENEPIRGTTWPPAINFYCTQYHGTCYSSNQNLPLSSQQTLRIGVPQRVLFYQVEYLNGSNQVVASDSVTAVAIP